MLLGFIWQYNTKQFNSFYLYHARMDGSTTSCTVLPETVTLSGDQNEVFESQVDFERLISWNPTGKSFFFLFQHLTFMV